ncbi:MAG: DUF4105 domain-containing protein [Elusimicrobia bacterium]|nr:DUF4105 domain-containing protein [Elusimicrobiota bacterium]
MTTPRVLLALALLLAPLGASAAPDGAYAGELTARARELRLAGERKWLKLLHYRPKGKGWRSEADGAAFFLAPGGALDPAAELESDLAAFFEPEPAKGQHPQCRFPARYHWLKEKLAFDPGRLPERFCTDFEAWRGAIDAEAVSVVFASAFLNNPASMYGHTFLRLHRRGGGDALLDYTINFAATPDTSNALMYTLKGLNGSFKGEYSLLPFYMKTQEYGSLEMRDLWDYRLNLTPSQIADLIRHGWEMGSTHFNYYFFTKNCSYQLLTLLEAADETLDVSSGFFWGVIPGDTVRVLQDRRGFVEEPLFRPSFVTEIKARRARQTVDELALATRLGREVTDEGLKRVATFPKDRQALILESANDYLRYRKGYYLEQSTETLTSIHTLLRARGRLGLPPAPADVERPTPLEAGHDTARLGLGGGVARSGSFTELAWRPSLHDLSSVDEGYTPDSQLEMGAARLRIDHDDRQLYVERLDIASIVALSPLDPWVRKPSWKLSTGVDQAKELGCSGAACMYYALNGGMGVAAQSRLLRRELYYVLAETDLGFGPILPQDWRAGAGGTAGVIVDLTARWRLLGEATYIEYAQRSAPRQRLRLTSSVRLTRDTELRLTLDRRTPDEEAGGMFFLYF